MGGARILIVEDEPSIGQGLCDVLTFRGHSVVWETNGLEASDRALSEPFDLLLLDVMLPDLDGFSICKRVRASGSKAGIIMLTAKGSEDDILRGFDLGADDYVTKPFSLKQLLARVEAILGRTRVVQETKFSAGDLSVDPSRAEAKGPRGAVELSSRELGVLSLLLEEPTRIVGRRALLRDVWEMKNPDSVETRTVDVHVGKLRKKLASICDGQIETVRGHGYRFAPRSA